MELDRDTQVNARCRDPIMILGISCRREGAPSVSQSILNIAPNLIYQFVFLEQRRKKMLHRAYLESRILEKKHLVPTYN